MPEDRPSDDPSGRLGRGAMARGPDVAAVRKDLLWGRSGPASPIPDDGVDGAARQHAGPPVIRSGRSGGAPVGMRVEPMPSDPLRSTDRDGTPGIGLVAADP